jgi:hypothetical protein
MVQSNFKFHPSNRRRKEKMSILYIREKINSTGIDLLIRYYGTVVPVIQYYSPLLPPVTIATLLLGDANDSSAALMEVVDIVIIATRKTIRRKSDFRYQFLLFVTSTTA